MVTIVEADEVVQPIAASTSEKVRLPEQEIRRAEHQNSGNERLRARHRDNAEAAFAQDLNAEELPGGERYERQRDVRQKAGAFYKGVRYHREAVRAEQYPGDKISGHVGKLQQPCDARHKKPEEQHRGDRNNGYGRGRIYAQTGVKIKQ